MPDLKKPNNTLEKQLMKRVMAGVSKVKDMIPPPTVQPKNPAQQLMAASPIIQLMSLLERGGAAVQNQLPPSVRAKLESLLNAAR